ncbi:hypothetical protein RAS12_07445 [Achromobacter seleniivolatilans]|uniref:Transmembrane protein n=1 Tax=Achromobacter seleniivolatilans TaxID=3047478 RepID=A0ABY9M6F8_9BURK|nr:hypothetical protein [Achromobacter sp. R39]WMD22203.1 hypothetical protein RAS12_07445 [Achromobacter sp. R39]
MASPQPIPAPMQIGGTTVHFLHPHTASSEAIAPEAAAYPPCANGIFAHLEPAGATPPPPIPAEVHRRKRVGFGVYLLLVFWAICAAMLLSFSVLTA